MANLLSWLGNGVKRLENTVNNDVVRPVQRVVAPPQPQQPQQFNTGGLTVANNPNTQQIRVNTAPPASAPLPINRGMPSPLQVSNAALPSTPLRVNPLPSPQQIRVPQFTGPGRYSWSTPPSLGNTLSNLPVVKPIVEADRAILSGGNAVIHSPLNAIKLGTANLTHSQEAADNARQQLQQAQHTVGGFAQGIPHGLVEGALSARELVPHSNQNVSVKPTNAVTRAIMGNQPVTSIQHQYTVNRQNGDSVANALTKAGISLAGDVPIGIGAAKLAKGGIDAGIASTSKILAENQKLGVSPESGYLSWPGSDKLTPEQYKAEAEKRLSRAANQPFANERKVGTTPNGVYDAVYRAQKGDSAVSNKIAREFQRDPQKFMQNHQVEQPPLTGAVGKNVNKPNVPVVAKTPEIRSVADAKHAARIAREEDFARRGLVKNPNTGLYEKVTPPTQGVNQALAADSKTPAKLNPQAVSSSEKGAIPVAKVSKAQIKQERQVLPESIATPKLSSTNYTTKSIVGQEPPDIFKPSKDSIQRGAERITAEDRSNAKLLGISPQRARSLRLRPPVPPELNGPVNEKLAGMANPLHNLPESPKGVGELPAVTELPASKKLLSNKVTALRQIGGKSGNELANRIVAIDKTRRDLRANWLHQSKTALSLNDKEFAQAVDVKEGKLAIGKVSPKIQSAVKEMRSVFPDVHKTGVGEGLMVGDRGNTYFPHSYPKISRANKAQIDSALQWLMDTHQVDHTLATQMFRDMQTEAAKFPNRFGHFENARMTNMPGYYKDKQAYLDYIDNASKRIAEARHFGADNQVANKLLDNLRMEGGDHQTASAAVANYLRSADRGLSSKPLAAARGFFGAARLGKASISHLGQTSNTAVEAGAARTIKGWGQFLSRNKEAKDFVDKTGVINPQELHSYRNQMTSVTGAMSEITAPLLESTMKMNRSVTALAGRAFGDHLAETSNVSKLRELGVTGDIGKKLTESQQIEAARGLVDQTMFSGSRATTPIYAETPIGKTIGQYRTAYSYKQGGFIWNQVIQEARKGNLAPLGRYLTISAGIGYGTVQVKQKISGSKEGTGGKVIDTLAGLGGIPGEAAVQLARYGKKDLTKSVAGLVAPLAGEAVDLGERATQALQGKPQQLERYGLGLVPVVGNRLAQHFVPYAPGSNKQQIANGAKQPSPGIYQVKAKDGSTQFTTLQGSKMTKFPSLQAAQTAQAKNEFKYSNKNETTIAGQPYHKTAAGKVVQGKMPQSTDHTYSVDNNAMTVKSSDVTRVHSENAAKLTSSKQSGDITGYMIAANAQLRNISHQLQDPKISAAKAQQVANEAQTLQSDMRKYATYGGFTKPSNVKSFKNIGSISGARPDYVSAITQSAAKYGVDTNAALAVAAMEGLGGGVGDNGTSYGPFQLHIGGALPQGKDQKWAESPQGIDYAMQQIAKVARGKAGGDAINAIVNAFEKPANPSNEIAGALSIYTGGKANITSGSPGGTQVASSSTGTKTNNSPKSYLTTAKAKSAPTPKFTTAKAPSYKAPKLKSTRVAAFKAPKVKTARTAYRVPKASKMSNNPAISTLLRHSKVA